MMPELVQWQKIDPDTGVCFPWFTHPFLEVLRTWDVSGKTVLEWGGGYSTIWWIMKGAFVHTVETSPKWAGEISLELMRRRLSYLSQLDVFSVNEGDPDQNKVNTYIGVRRDPDLQKPDIVVVDGILRFECMKEGIELLAGSGGKLIVDNYQQDGFICPACAELVKPFYGEIYRQPDHTDHHGNPWQTGFWEIPAQ